MIKSKLKLLIAQREVSMSVRITYESLAAEVGLSKNALNRLAEGKTDRVEFGTLDKLCDYFRCDVADLLSHEPDKVKGVGPKQKIKTRQN